MWPQIVFRVILLFICIGLSFSKRHSKKYRGSAPTLWANNHTDMRSKDVYSIADSKPIVIGIKNALDPVECLTKWLADVAVNQDEQELHATSPKSDAEKSLIHISQTEYPQIFHTQKLYTDTYSNWSYDNGFFYPFKNFTMASLDVLNPNLVSIKLQDSSSLNRENDEEIEEANKRKPQSDQMPQTRKIFKYGNTYGKQTKKGITDDTVATNSSTTDSESLILNFLNGSAIKNFENKMFKKSNMGFNKNHEALTIPHSKTSKYNEAAIKEESSTVGHAESITDLSDIADPLVAVSQTESALVTKGLNKKIVPYVTGTMDPNNSLNLRISLTLTINNDSYSLIPTQ